MQSFPEQASKDLVDPSGAPIVERTPEDTWRANTYRLLAGLLAAPPTEQLIDLISEINISPAEHLSPMATAWEKLKHAGQSTDIAMLDSEYHKLFIGISRGEIVPYASWYRTGAMMEKPLVGLRSTLKSLGFERQKGVYEPEDHAGALCEVMGMIIENAEDIDFDRQRGFFEEHIEPWMGMFFADLKRAKSAKFYTAVGELGERFIALEQQYFSMIV